MAGTFFRTSDSAALPRTIPTRSASASVTKLQWGLYVSIWATTSTRLRESKPRRSLSLWVRHFERSTTTALLGSPAGATESSASVQATSTETRGRVDSWWDRGSAAPSGDWCGLVATERQVSQLLAANRPGKGQSSFGRRGEVQGLRIPLAGDGAERRTLRCGGAWCPALQQPSTAGGECSSRAS